MHRCMHDGYVVFGKDTACPICDRTDNIYCGSLLDKFYHLLELYGMYITSLTLPNPDDECLSINIRGDTHNLPPARYFNSENGRVKYLAGGRQMTISISYKMCGWRDMDERSFISAIRDYCEYVHANIAQIAS